MSETIKTAMILDSNNVKNTYNRYKDKNVEEVEQWTMEQLALGDSWRDFNNSGVNARFKEYLLLNHINFDEHRMQAVKQLLQILYPDMKAEDFFSFSKENPIDRNRPIPGVLPNTSKKPDIEVVVADWDGTVGDYYEYIAEAVDTLLWYTAETRGINREELDKHLIQFGKDKVAECFKGPAYFSVGGAREILNSQQLRNISSKDIDVASLSQKDDIFLDTIFHSRLISAYSHIYSDTLEFFGALQDKNIPVYIHSDSPLSEMIEKLKYSGMAKFKYDENGEIIAVEKCMFAGISTKKDRGEPTINAAKEERLINMFKEKGIDLILNTQEECKPDPRPLTKIQDSLEKKGYGRIAPDKMLMVGDFMAKDGMFAAKAGMYYAWPGDRAIKTDKAVKVNKITAAADIGYRNNISKQLEVLANEMLDRDTDKMQDFAKHTAICKDYTTLLEYFRFETPKGPQTKSNSLLQSKEETPIIRYIINDLSNCRQI